MKMHCASPLPKLPFSSTMANLSNTQVFLPAHLKLCLPSHNTVIAGRRFYCLQLHPRFKLEHAFCALATVESGSLTPMSNLESQIGGHLNVEVSRDLSQEDSDLDEKEKLRRTKISRANKGNIPWNKGKKHSPETRQRIRERTKLAMQNPKVKMKLVHFVGNSHSEETKSKIAHGVKEGWRRRIQTKMIQEYCHVEWCNVIAEAARVGFYGEKELLWNSYELLLEELQQEWSVQVVKTRREVVREKRSSPVNRPPHSPERRKKIAEAIRAKWADPDYRERVRTGMVNYHGSMPDREKKPKKKPEKTSFSYGKISSRSEIDEGEIERIIVHKEKKKYLPTYKDPMVSTKLEMIKKLKDERLARESKKEEAAKRAKLLIAEAEKAMEALEFAAVTNPLAEQALEEAKYLIAEATKMLDSIKHCPLPADSSLNSISLPDSGTSNQVPAKLHINGKNMSNFNGSALNLALGGPEKGINGFNILFNDLVEGEEISRAEEEDDKR